MSSYMRRCVCMYMSTSVCGHAVKGSSCFRCVNVYVYVYVYEYVYVYMYL